MIDEQLTQNFWLREFLFSPTATRLGLDIVPTPLQVDNAQRVAEALEQVRGLWDRPIVITSGIRPVWLNRLLGGAIESAHLQGLAADFNIAGIRPSQIFWAIKDQLKHLEVDQVILEFNRWVHLSVPPAGGPPRREFLIATHFNGRTSYERAA